MIYNKLSSCSKKIVCRDNFSQYEEAVKIKESNHFEKEGNWKTIAPSTKSETGS